MQPNEPAARGRVASGPLHGAPELPVIRRSAAEVSPGRLAEIERRADELFRGYFGALPWREDAADEVPAEPAALEVWTADIGDRTVGFAKTLEVDEYLHLEQLSVDPAWGRRGIGRALVSAVLEDAAARGCTAVTLRTFAEVPWNEPFYVGCGFRRVETAPTPFHEQLVRTERRLGLLEYGTRVHMLANLPAE